MRKLLIVLAVALAATLPSFADDLAVAGRQAAEKYENAIVKVQLVAKMTVSYEGREGSKREQKSETTATVIDPSGLAVVSLAATNPAEAYTNMMGSDEDLDIKTQVTDVKFRMGDGEEIPAKIVLRDKDLDLAFVRPVQKPDKPFNYIDLEQSNRPDRLDQIFVMCRLGKVANRSLSICPDRIEAIVEKPRTFFIPGVAGMTGDMGSPVFSYDGKIVGILILRTIPRGGDEGGFSLSSTGMLPMILPASDIMKVAKQAPEEAAKEPAVAPGKPAAPAKPAPAKAAPAKPTAPVKKK